MYFREDIDGLLQQKMGFTATFHYNPQPKAFHALFKMGTKAFP